MAIWGTSGNEFTVVGGVGETTLHCMMQLIDLVFLSEVVAHCCTVLTLEIAFRTVSLEFIFVTICQMGLQAEGGERDITTFVGATSTILVLPLLLILLLLVLLLLLLRC